MTTKLNKIRPKHCHKNKNTKSGGGGEGGEIERTKAKWTEGCWRERGRQIPLELKLLVA